MAVVTVKSTAITARDGTPPSKPGLGLGSRRQYSFVGTVEVTNGDSIGSKYVLGSVPSSARMSMLVKLSDAITSAAADFGLYRTTQDGGAAVSASVFGSAVSLASADTTGTNVLHESGTLDIAYIEKPLWQVLGLSADPGLVYDVVATLTAAATASGTLSVRCVFGEGN